MAQLNNHQLLLLTELNSIRLALIDRFREAEHPNSEDVFRELLRLEVLLMENKHKEHLGELLKENQDNLSHLIDHLLFKEENKMPTKKFNVKWNISSPQNPNKQEISEPKVPENKVKLNFNMNIPAVVNMQSFKPSQVPMAAKAVIPPGQFVSASFLPKGTSIRKKFVPPFKKADTNMKQVDEKDEDNEYCKEPAFKNLEEKLVNIIMSQIMEKGEEVKWNSIAGLGFAKKVIHEMIVWPMLRPDLFTGLRSPPRAILLFGPPGTGKTLIGKAIASEASATFFSISASSLTSKWVGQSQKLVKTLFAIARAKQPSVIFIDEIDSLLSARGEGEQQSTRRVKTEFLVELDGAKTNNHERVLVIGATNLPQELDDAVRRRFVKRLYIPLPNHEGRSQLIRNLTSNSSFRLDTEEISNLTLQTRGFSGADLYNLCAQAAMVPLRQMSSIENVRHSQVPCSEAKHFEQALTFVRPSVNKKMLISFGQFNKLYGSYQIKQEQQSDSEEANEVNSKYK